MSTIWFGFSLSIRALELMLRHKRNNNGKYTSSTTFIERAHQEVNYKQQRQKHKKCLRIMDEWFLIVAVLSCRHS